MLVRRRGSTSSARRIEGAGLVQFEVAAGGDRVHYAQIAIKQPPISLSLTRDVSRSSCGAPLGRSSPCVLLTASRRHLNVGFQRYGQEVADLIGQSGANGQSFTEESSISTELGDRTGIQAVEETLAYYGSKTNAPTWLQPLWDQLDDIFGSSATGSGKLNFGHAINNEWITGAPGTDGKIYQYTQIADALYAFTAALAQATGGEGLAPAKS